MLIQNLGDEARGGQGFTPGWKPHLSVKTAKKGSLLTTDPKGYSHKKVSSKTHGKFMKLFKHREAGGWKEAKGYKKHLKALAAMTTKSTKSGYNVNLGSVLKKDPKKFASFIKKYNKTVGVFPYVKGKTKASTAMGKASTSTFLQRRMALGMGNLQL